MPKLREELQFTSLDEREIIRPKEGVSLYYKNGVMKILHANGDEQTLLAGEDVNIDLSQYYTKAETDSAISEAIANLNTSGFEVIVGPRPTVGESGKLYLVPVGGSEGNVHEEYLYINGKWELVGSTKIELPDFSLYALKTDIPTHISDLIDDAGHATKADLDLKANVSDVYTKQEVTTLLGTKANTSDLENKQDTLVSGTNIKTINGQPILGSGDIQVAAEGGSDVIANPELDGGEEILESIQIEDVKYSLQGQDMTFSESISEDPEAKILKTITIGTDDWKVDKGSVVRPNPELSGNEEVLESVQIDDATFTLKGEEMIFSENPVEGATPLRNIQLGNDNWAITGGGDGSNVIPNPDLTGGEEALESVGINGVNYSVLGSDITFSETSKTGYSLKSITVGNTVWSVSGGSGSGDLTGYATESYVNTKVSELVNSAPGTLDTLGELATALQQNQTVVETLDTAITNKLDKTMIVYSETEPENPTTGLIWLKKI